MSTAGIILLVLGAIIFVVSYFIPDRVDKENKKDIEKKREQIRRLMETELDGMKLRVNEATNETVEFGMDKSERALEKIANEKIMAVSEYASTIMEEIDRNHKEVLFLYDMLNDKQTDVKNTVRHAEAAVREAEDAAKTASDTAMYAVNIADQVNEKVSEAAVNTAPNQIGAGQVVNASADIQSAQAAGIVTQAERILNSQGGGFEQQGNGFDIQGDFATAVDYYPQATAPSESVFGMAAREDFSELVMPAVEPVVPVKTVEPEPEPQLTEMEMLERTTKFNNMSNNNQRILKLNGQGVPVVDIARQLGLGVGEVQLVIDLFK